MTIETLSNSNIEPLARLFLELWPDSTFDEELENCKSILKNETETCFLIKNQEDHFAFIHITLRYDYVEGAGSSPVAYIEGIYVRENYRHLGIGKTLIQLGEEWAKQKGCSQIASDTEIGNMASITFHEKMDSQKPTG